MEGAGADIVRPFIAAKRSAMLAPTLGTAGDGDGEDEVEAECCSTGVMGDEVDVEREVETERVWDSGCCFSSARFSNMLTMLPSLPGLRDSSGLPVTSVIAPVAALDGDRGTRLVDVHEAKVAHKSMLLMARARK